MPLLFTLLIFLGLAPASYQAVVVDATTGQPLAGVHVADLTTGTSFATDAAGRFTLPGPTAQVRLRQPAEATGRALRMVQALFYGHGCTRTESPRTPEYAAGKRS